ncbi:MAG: hypothetical protein IJ419_00725 [Agathobacter sp.]|nr:hypothetical protein [Agathobacter sp.]
MGRLIIDGNSVFEIDEECMKRRRPVPECDVEKYLQTECEKSSYEKSKNKKMYKD